MPKQWAAESQSPRLRGVGCNPRRTLAAPRAAGSLNPLVYGAWAATGPPCRDSRPPRRGLNPLVYGAWAATPPPETDDLSVAYHPIRADPPTFGPHEDRPPQVLLEVRSAIHPDYHRFDLTSISRGSRRRYAGLRRSPRSARAGCQGAVGRLAATAQGRHRRQVPLNHESRRIARGEDQPGAVRHEEPVSAVRREGGRQLGVGAGVATGRVSVVLKRLQSAGSCSSTAAFSGGGAVRAAPMR